ncbi:macrophage mannose receptor 1-like [Antedon mediterranea]|uniref:macrophage mannose receptor 1-like n=1 Tax=Antedon mediterranea TaxID=105859 RepID=UPI003AF661E1
MMSITDWEDGEPNLSNGHCVVFNGVTGLWSSRNCSESNWHFCEADYFTPWNWYPVGEKMYLVPPQYENFEDARKACYSFGASLAVIQNEEESANIIEAGLSVNRNLDIANTNLAYIGYRRKSKSAVSWAWIDSSETSQYSNFSADQILSDENEACSALDFKDGSWKTSTCTHKRPYVCEKGLEWHYFNNKRYAFIKHKLHQEFQRNDCSRINSALLEIESVEENSFILSAIEPESAFFDSFFFNYRYSYDDSKWYVDGTMQEMTYDGFTNDNNRHPNIDLNRNCSSIAVGKYTNRGIWSARYCNASLDVTCNGPQRHVNTMWNGKTYSILESEMTFEDAQTRCSELGLVTVRIDSLQEAIFIARSIRRYRKNSYKVWIGHVLPSLYSEFVWTTAERSISWEDLRSRSGVRRAILSDYCINMSLRGRHITLSYSSCIKTRIVVCESQESTHSTFERVMTPKVGTAITGVTPPNGFVRCGSTCTDAIGCVAYNYLSSSGQCELLGSVDINTDDAREGLRQYSIR